MSLAKARKMKGHQTKTMRWAAASNKELKEDESSLESNSDSKELVGSTETSDFPKDTDDLNPKTSRVGSKYLLRYKPFKKFTDRICAYTLSISHQFARHGH